MRISYPLNKILVRIIDNTKLNGADYAYYKKGYSDPTRLLEPNEGEVIGIPPGHVGYKVGQRVHFSNLAIIEIDCDKALVDASAIFLADLQLSKAGVIVVKHLVHQTMSGVVFRNQEFFKVLQSNLPSVIVNGFIIAKPYTAYRYYADGEQYFYVAPGNILVTITDDVRPGPDYVLVPEGSPLLYTQSIGTLDLPAGRVAIAHNATAYAILD